MDNPKVSIIILNWNGWEDTPPSQKSIFRFGRNGVPPSPVRKHWKRGLIYAHPGGESLWRII